MTSMTPERLSQLEGCKELIKEGVEMLGGRLDILVNNAGAGKFNLKLADITPEGVALAHEHQRQLCHVPYSTGHSKPREHKGQHRQYLQHCR